MDDETVQLVKLLQKLEPGFLPLPIFLEICRLTVTSIVEIVPFRKTEKGIEVLLTKREDDDEIWPGMWHTSGTVVRASDQEGSYKDAFDRILVKELNGLRCCEPVFVRNIFHKVARGMESSQIYWVEVDGNETPPVGEFFETNSLPENLVSTTKRVIDVALEGFTN